MPFKSDYSTVEQQPPKIADLGDKCFTAPFANKIRAPGRRTETNKCGAKRIQLMLQGRNVKSEQKRKMATDLIISYLLLRDGNFSERKQKVAEIFIAKMPSRVKASRDFIMSENATLLKNYKAVIDASK